MLTYLDSCILIYRIEGPAPFETRVRTHIGALEAAGSRFAVSELSRLECFVKPLATGDGALLLDYEELFLAANLEFVPLTAPVYERAAKIRAGHTPIGRFQRHPHRRAALIGGYWRLGLWQDG